MCTRYLVVDFDVDPKQDQYFIDRKTAVEAMQERVKKEDCLNQLFWINKQ